jgi:hypothetical protein
VLANDPLLELHDDPELFLERAACPAVR